MVEIFMLSYFKTLIAAKGAVKQVSAPRDCTEALHAGGKTCTETLRPKRYSAGWPGDGLLEAEERGQQQRFGVAAILGRYCNGAKPTKLHPPEVPRVIRPCTQAR